MVQVPWDRLIPIIVFQNSALRLLPLEVVILFVRPLNQIWLVVFLVPDEILPPQLGVLLGGPAH